MQRIAMLTLLTLASRVAATAEFLRAPPAQTAAALPDDTLIRHLPLLDRQVIFVRDAAVAPTLAKHPALDRGSSMNLLRSMFGWPLFLLPRGVDHAARKREFKDSLGKERITASIPTMARSAVATVDGLCAGMTPGAGARQVVDMAGVVTGYLFRVAGPLLCGVPVDLQDEVESFRLAADIVLDGASSALANGGAALRQGLAPLVARSAHEAVDGMLGIGRRLLLAAARDDQDRSSLVSRMITRHGLDPATVDERTAWPASLQQEVTLTFSASIFTTSHLILMTLHHFYEHPDALAGLRHSIAQDFPEGVGPLSDLKMCDSVRQLLQAFRTHSPVGVAARDVTASLRFSDSFSDEHELRPGDIVVFDLDALQRSVSDEAWRRWAEADGPMLDRFDVRHNNVVKTFFTGTHQCPGRFLAEADAQLLLLELLRRVDGRWLDPDRRVQHGLVKRHTGDMRMEIRAHTLA